jgi:hypothetical protein
MASDEAAADAQAQTVPAQPANAGDEPASGAEVRKDPKAGVAATAVPKDATGVGASNTPAEGIPNPPADAAAAKPRKKLTWKDYALTFGAIIFFLWSVGIFDMAYAFALRVIFPPTMQSFPNNYGVLVPLGVIGANSANQTMILQFMNSASDELTIFNATVVNLASGECKVMSKLPTNVAPNARFNLSLAGCDIGRYAAPRFGFVVGGGTSMRSLLLSSGDLILPGPSADITPDQKRMIQERMRAQLDAMPDANVQIAFTSSGTVFG